MQFNTSRFNPIGLGLQETIHGHFVMPHSNESGLVSSQLLTNNPAIRRYQNEIIPQSSQPIVSIGQLGLGQTVTELRRTYVTPHRVQVHTVIDYFPMQNQPTVPMSEVRVTEVVRTQFLTPTSTRESTLVPNGSVQVQGQVGFQNQSVNDLFTENVPFHGPLYQNMTQNHQALNFVGLNHHTEPKRDEVLSPKPFSVFIPKAKLNLSGNHISNHDQVGLNFQNPSMNESIGNQMRSPNLINCLRAPSPVRLPSQVYQSVLDDNNDVEDDGRTHSLPTKKYGPYTCPKCRRVFYTSQSFAAHIGSHYKHESRAERKKRQVAKYKKKYLRLFQSRYGLTVKPASFKMERGSNARGKKKATAISKEIEVLKTDQIVQGVPTKRDLPSAGVKIKKEPI